MEEADLIANFEPGIENQSEPPRPSTPVRPSSPANEQPSEESSRRHDSSVNIPHKKDDDEEEHKDGAKKDSHEKRTNTYIGWTSSPSIYYELKLRPWFYQFKLSDRSSPFPISKDKDSKQRRDSGSSSDGEKDGRNMSRPHRTIFALKISNKTIGRILLMFLVVVFIVFCYSILADWSSYKCAISEKKGNTKKRYPL
ncbi:Hypothetical predicted protein [Cloeon dipterum]|uniref:Uncharacterized protein n=1 Tax=Cloeon dipterum TaxID=197152 RepID=A0A8S1CR49_9INSE|nr:Hypothetical predicted protein [Cloeon dipterum]